MTKAEYIARAEYQDKLAVWARRARKPCKAAKHESNAAWYRAEAAKQEA